MFPSATKRLETILQSEDEHGACAVIQNMKGFQAFLKENIFIDSKNKSSKYPFMTIAQYSIYYDRAIIMAKILSMLKNLGFSFDDIFYQSGTNLLHFALEFRASKCAIKLIEMIKQEKPDQVSRYINSENNCGEIPLHIVLRNPVLFDELFSILYENGADFFYESKNIKFSPAPFTEIFKNKFDIQKFVNHFESSKIIQKIKETKLNRNTFRIDNAGISVLKLIKQYNYSNAQKQLYIQLFSNEKPKIQHIHQINNEEEKKSDTQSGQPDRQKCCNEDCQVFTSNVCPLCNKFCCPEHMSDHQCQS